MDAMRICADLWLVLAAVWVVFAFRTKPVQQRANIPQRLVYGLLVIAALWLPFSERVPGAWLRWQLYEPADWIDAVGVTLTAAGVALAIWARVLLGGNWSSAVTVKVGHELIRSGPYRLVRHPIYTGISLALLGSVTVRGQVRGVLGIALLLAGFWMKLRIEEGFMRKTFGAQYDEYARATGALLPRLRN